MNQLGYCTAAAALMVALLTSPTVPTGPTSQTGLQTSITRLVLAVATDPRNRPIVDVGPDDFVVSENGASREVLSVRIADYPIAIALDTRPSQTDFAVVQQAARRFVEQLGADRPVIVTTLGGPTPKPIVTFEDSRSTLLLRLSALTQDTSGERTSLLTGIAAVANTLRATETLFSAIVVLSAAPGETADPAGGEAVKEIVRSGAMVHAIVNQAGGAQGMPGLRTLVTQTRGDLTAIYAAASYPAALDRLVSRLSSEILIEYISPAGSKAADVKVGIRMPGARVRGLGFAPR